MLVPTPSLPDAMMSLTASFASPFLAALLLAALSAAPAAAQARAGDADQLAEAGEALATARTEKEAAYEALESMVRELHDDFVALTTGPDAATRRHALVLLLQDSLEAARTRLSAENAKGRAVLRGVRRRILDEAFLGPVAAAPPVDARLAGWVARAVAEELSKREGWDDVGEDELLRLIDGLFPEDRSWFQFWNDRFHHSLPETKRWQDAQADYEEAGLRLERLRNPERYGKKGEVAPPGMVIVPGGVYELGPNTGWERPWRRVTLKVFAIDRHEVTHGEYALYVNALAPEDRRAAMPRGWSLNSDGLAAYPRDLRDHPAVYVNWDQAAAYAAWAGKRLPTEAEWEAAAAGTDGLAYTWGNEYHVGMANGDHEATGTLPVEAYPDGRSPVGCYDLIGNAWEWTSTLEDGSTVSRLPEGLVNVAIRGGGWDSRREELTTRYRWTAPGHAAFASPRYNRPIGFRCVKDL
jgi:formylglycine-generating enzyme required for sulfatase activity